jgi:hypothetical protein
MAPRKSILRSIRMLVNKTQLQVISKSSHRIRIKINCNQNRFSNRIVSVLIKCFKIILEILNTNLPKLNHKVYTNNHNISTHSSQLIRVKHLTTYKCRTKHLMANYKHNNNHSLHICNN